jgi:hypothetical protein
MNGRDDRSYPHIRQKPDTSRYISIHHYSREQRAKRACLHAHLAAAARVKYSVACSGALTERIIEAECMSEGVRISRR